MKWTTNKIAQSVKSLLCKHNDMSSIPNTHIKSQAQPWGTRYRWTPEAHRLAFLVKKWTASSVRDSALKSVKSG